MRREGGSLRFMWRIYPSYVPPASRSLPVAIDGYDRYCTGHAILFPPTATPTRRSLPARIQQAPLSRPSTPPFYLLRQLPTVPTTPVDPLADHEYSVQRTVTQTDATPETHSAGSTRCPLSHRSTPGRTVTCSYIACNSIQTSQITAPPTFRRKFPQATSTTFP